MTAALWPLIPIVGEFLLKLALVSFILLRRPSGGATNLAWIMIIFAVPLLGIVLYLFVGEVRLGRKRMRQHAEIVALVVHQAHEARSGTAVPAPRIPHAYAPIATLAESVGGTTPSTGNRLELIGDATACIDTMVRDIDAAVAHCHLLFYIFADDQCGRPVAEALVRAARRKVTCRLLVDAVGSADFLDSNTRSELEDAGVRVVAMLPTNPLRALFARIDVRNHRKIAVIDGVIGYMGSQNIVDPAFPAKPHHGPWVDAMVRITGPATRDLQVLFVEDWYLDSDEAIEHVLAIEPLPTDENVVVQIMGTGPNAFNEALRQLNLAAFHAAREELVLTTPYFVPDDATLVALRAAALRGVATTLVLPKHNDAPIVAAASRSYYAPLLDVGVRIHEYTKGVLHAKTMTVDRDLALITTANLDRRSLEINLEASMVVYDSDFASRLRFLQTSYLSNAEPVDAGRWSRRAWSRQLVQNAAGILSPLL